MNVLWPSVVACPTCGAVPDALCVDEGGEMMVGSVHARRRRRYRQVYGR